MSGTHLAIVLHAHLPYVRHPEHERSLEERWLFEAILECYLPLLDAFDRLEAEGVPFRLTMSLTPPLASMLADPMLQGRFHEYLTRLEALAEVEMVRLYGDASFAPVATFYRDRFAKLRGVWDRYQGNVVRGLRGHWDRGNIELIACSATHAYLPGYLPTPESIGAQLRLGMAAFASLVGRPAHGMWLPECAYDPAFDGALAGAGVKYTLLDEHGVTHARPRPPAGVFAPIASPAGTAFFARDPASSAQVWSRESGYPGDPFYRDFYRDIGFDLPEDLLRDEVGPFGTRVMTGLKYYRITGPGDHKEPYQPGVAMERVHAHAHDFVEARRRQAQDVGASIIVSPYDAELFGHWWFEGPDFIEAVFRALAQGTDGRLAAVTLGEHLAARPELAVATPAPSSWGEAGYGEVWVGPKSGHLWRHVHHASRYVKWLVDRHRGADGFRGEVLDQVIRELLLLQSSDWAFILHTGTSTGYAEARVRAHVRRLRHLGHLLEKPAPDGADARFLADLQERDAFLSHFEGPDLRDTF